MKQITKPFMPPSLAERGASWRANFVREATIKSLAVLRKASRDDIELEMRAPVQALRAADFPQDSVSALMTLANDTALSEILGLGKGRCAGRFAILVSAADQSWRGAFR
jgi:hypothetical protein